MYVLSNTSDTKYGVVVGLLVVGLIKLNTQTATAAQPHIEGQIMQSKPQFYSTFFSMQVTAFNLPPF